MKTSYTRSAFYAYFGFMAVLWVLWLILVLVLAYVTKDSNLLILALVMLVLSPVLAYVVDRRLRSYRSRIEQKKRT